MQIKQYTAILHYKRRELYTKSQASIEYLTTYGLIIVVIAAALSILYALGIFSPPNYIQTAVNGFPNFGVQAQCIQGGALQMQITNTLDRQVNITEVNATDSISGKSSNTQKDYILLDPGQSSSYYVLNVCPTSTGSQYSISATITYDQIGLIEPGPYFSTGTISGSTVTVTPSLVASFDGPKSPYEPCGSSTSTCTYIIAHQPIAGVNKSYTMVTWLYTPGWNGGSSWDDAFFTLDAYGAFSFSSTDLNVHTCYNDPHSSSLNVNGNTNEWLFVAVSVNNKTGLLYSFYLNNQLVSTWANTTRDQTSGNEVMIGGQFQQCDSNPFTGMLSDAQLYNASLSTTQIDRLYKEGMGGAPLPNTGLVAWWPLNGNANDFSGNGNNGITTNVSWVSP